MSKIVITIARQYGSGGLDIGKKIANDLGISFYDKNLIEIAAKMSGVDKEFMEKSDEKVHFRGFFGGMGDILFSAFGIEFTEHISNSIFKIQSDIIRSLANNESAVFVGRCADYILREHRHKASIFVCANMQDRINNITIRDNISPEEAFKEIEKNDKQRNKYYNYYTSIERGNAKYYDLCINSSSLGLDETANAIKEFAIKKLKLKKDERL